MDIGAKIEQLISKKKLTKKDVSEKLGIARVTLDDYIANNTSITVNKLLIFCRLVGIDVKNFFDDDYKLKDDNDVDSIIDQFAEMLKKQLKK
jgi:transcriptional regulator with XRE-family HTH domain